MNETSCPIVMDKVSSGSSLSRTISLRRGSPRMSLGSVANSNVEQEQVTSIGKSWWPSSPGKGCEELNKYLEKKSMPNSPSPKLPITMCGKTRPEWMAHLLNLEPSPFEETPKRIGSPCGPPPSPETWKPSPHIHEYCVLGQFYQLQVILTSLLQLNEAYKFIGVELERAKVSAPGKSQEWELTVRTQEVSSGLDTEVKTLLSSMNFEAELTYPTSSDGQIVIRSWWNSKGPVSRWLHDRYGSHLM
nr:MAG: hypothetical protein [Chemarfal virus 174]